MKLKSLVLAAMMAGVAVPAIAQANPLPEGPHITTSGNAIIKASPDMATLNINVEVTEKMQQRLKQALINVLLNILSS